MMSNNQGNNKHKVDGPGLKGKGYDIHVNIDELLQDSKKKSL